MSTKLILMLNNQHMKTEEISRDTEDKERLAAYDALNEKTKALLNTGAEVIGGAHIMEAGVFYRTFRISKDSLMRVTLFGDPIKHYTPIKT